MTAKSKYAVVFPTPMGEAVIESEAQWDAFRKMAHYLELSRRAKVNGTGKIPVSTLFTNTEEDARREFRH